MLGKVRTGVRLGHTSFEQLLGYERIGKDSFLVSLGLCVGHAKNPG
jgi:hypothetical protein